MPPQLQPGGFMRSTLTSISRALGISLFVVTVMAFAPGCGPDEICSACDKAGTLEWCTSCDSAANECTMTIRKKNGGGEVFSCKSKVAQTCGTDALVNYCDGR